MSRDNTETNLTDVTRDLPHASVGIYRQEASVIYRVSRKLSRKLRGTRIVHISGSRLRKKEGRYVLEGGGLAEILKSQIPLERSFGLESRLFLACLSPEFYAVCRKIYDLIVQASDKNLTDHERAIYTGKCEKLGSRMSAVLQKKSADLIVIHDFEYLPIIDMLPKDIPIVLHWHVGFPKRAGQISEILAQYVRKASLIIVSEEQVANLLRRFNPNVFAIAPALNPSNPKNKPIKRQVAAQLLSPFGIDPSRPIVAQIGRLSKQKNSHQAIAVFKHVQRLVPDAQLILAGLYNTPGKDSEDYLHMVNNAATTMNGVFVFSNSQQTKGLSNDAFINAVLTTSDVVLNMSSGEAFGLAITEAMWKGKPVVARKSPGASLQISHGRTGMIASSIHDASSMTAALLQNSTLRFRIGRQAKNSVKKNCLFIRYFRDIITAYSSCLLTIKTNKNNKRGTGKAVAVRRC